MKKILTGLISYCLIASIACIFIGAFAFGMPLISPSDVFAYRLNSGLLFMLTVLPSTAITGFLLGCAVSFGDVKAPANTRFSNALLGCFKSVLIIGVAVTFALSMVHDVFLPVLKQRKVEFEEKPAMIEQYLNLSQNYLLKSIKNKEYANLSNFYSKKVLELDPKNEKAKDLVKRSEIAGAVKENKETIKAPKKSSVYVTPEGGLTSKEEQVELTEILKMHSSSVYELLQESERLFALEDYLGSHYYAQLAVKIADGKDANFAKAKEMANRSWNILSEAQVESLTEENLFFRKKVEGYTKLMNGDYLSSYYIFQTLANKKIEYERDSDVKRYLNIARYELMQDYFFIDETADKDSFEGAENVYFSLHHKNGTYDIFFIKGITDINETGNMVRYLREVHIYSFDSYGDFAKSMTVPYAKMVAIDVNSLSEEQKKNLGVDDKWKIIPYLQLCSVDRDIEGVKVVPTYLRENGERVDGSNQMLLAMPYDDFGIISNCTSGVQQMNFWSMNKMKLSADSYGYSNEIILESVMLSIFYPFVILFLMILTATIGWNYRLQSTKLFKFVWVFSLPLVHIIIYGAVGFFEFAIKLMNFIFMGIAGINFALYLGMLFYVIVIVFISFMFISRKGD